MKAAASNPPYIVIRILSFGFAAAFLSLSVFSGGPWRHPCRRFYWACSSECILSYWPQNMFILKRLGGFLAPFLRVLAAHSFSTIEHQGQCWF